MNRDRERLANICEELDMENTQIVTWQERKAYYHDLFAGKNIWIAVVDDVPFEAGIISELFRCLNLTDDRTSKNAPDIVVHEFYDAEGLVKRASDYDLLIMDANFGPGLMIGPRAAAMIKERYPDIPIVGRSGEPKMNRKFEKVGVDLVIPKDNEGDLVSRFGEILTLLEDRVKSSNEEFDS